MAACVATPKSCGTCMFVVTGIYENAIIVWAQRYILCFGAFFPYRKDSRGCFVSRRPWGPFFSFLCSTVWCRRKYQFRQPFRVQIIVAVRVLVRVLVHVQVHVRVLVQVHVQVRVLVLNRALPVLVLVHAQIHVARMDVDARWMPGT